MARRGRRDQRNCEIHGEHRYLGELQAQVMDIAWKRRVCTVRVVLDDLGTDRDVAYTTVMTVMSRLASEGMLTRELVGKTFVYRPACTREELRATLSSGIITDLVTDFGDLALAQFVDALEQADPARLERLRVFFAEPEPADDGA